MSTRSMSSRRKRATARRNVQPQRPAIPRPEQRQPEPQTATDSAGHAGRSPDTAQTTRTGQPVPPPAPMQPVQPSLPADAAARADKWARSDEPGRMHAPRLMTTNSAADDDFEQPFPVGAPVRWSAARHGSGFSWREREWRSSGLLRRARVLPSIAVLLAIVALAGGFAYVLANRAENSTQNAAAPQATSAPQSGVLVQHLQPGLTPTPQMPPYEIGIWVSDPTPGTGGVEQVFVRVSHQVAAVVGAPVTLTVQFPSGTNTMGPTPTGADGVVAFNVSYGFSPPGQPVFVTASATEGGQTLTAETTFFPA